MNTPFEKRRSANVDEASRAAAEASAHMKALMKSPEGLWLIRQILDIGEPFRNPTNFNNRDYYAMGKRAVALRLLWLMRQHGDKAALVEIISDLPLE